MRATHPHATGAAAPRPSRHQSFLVYDRFRWLKIAIAIAAVSIVIYVIDQPYGTAYGGSWAGYTLGTVGALLILWLTWFGYRKRTYATNSGILVGRLSAHVYLGLCLIIVATLHTGFHFGWNIHTLAYVLMCCVIASGVFGILYYARYPRMMTANRQNTTMRQMLGRIAALNEELRASALTLDDKTARLVDRSVTSTEIGGTARQQLTGRYPGCATAAALAGMDAMAGTVPPNLQNTMRQLRVLLDEKSRLLDRVRRDIRYKAFMDIWLYVHVPLTFALLAALLAHVIAVFFLW